MMVNELNDKDKSTGNELWECIKLLSDSEILGIQEILCHEFMSVVATDSDTSNEIHHSNRNIIQVIDRRVTEPLQNKIDENKYISMNASTFIRLFLSHIHALVHEQNKQSISLLDSPTIASSQAQPYELNNTNFPSLNASNTFDKTSLTANTLAPKIKNKRRITTTIIPANKPSHLIITSQSFHSKMPNEASKIELLEQRMTLNSKTNNVLPTSGKERKLMIEHNTIYAIQQQDHLNYTQEVEKNEDKHTKAPDSLPASPSTSINSVSKRTSFHSLTTNVQAAKIYGFLLNNRFVFNICVELQILISCIFRIDCDIPCAQRNVFCSQINSIVFALTAFMEMKDLLNCLDMRILETIRTHLDNVSISKLSREIKSFHTIAQQIMQSREQQRAQASAQMGCRLPIEAYSTPMRAYAIPFCEITDSRLHYRTPTESQLYSNREKSRDSFLSLLRNFNKQKNSLLGNEAKIQAASTAVLHARELLQFVCKENKWWFAKFFVLELVQVGSDPFEESDAELVKKIFEDKLISNQPDRLIKLNRRLSSQKSSTGGSNRPIRTEIGGHNPNNGFIRDSAKTLKKYSKPTSSKENHTKPRASFTNFNQFEEFISGFDQMHTYFTDNQRFFLHFLQSCDSFEFSQLVLRHLQAQFSSTWRNLEYQPTATAKATNHFVEDEVAIALEHARKQFTPIALKLKVMAKFLGFFQFSSQWGSSTVFIRNQSVTDSLSQNQAFEQMHIESISTLNMIGHVGQCLDLKTLLESAIMNDRLSLAVPCACDYISLIVGDSISGNTMYWKQILILIDYIRRSKRVFTLGEKGFHIALQIDALFHQIGIENFLDVSDYYNKELAPSSAVRSHLSETASVVSSKSFKLDQTSYLYGQVFIQTCVGQLDDLFSFIQHQFAPTHRISQSKLHKRTSSAVSVRKLRPIQLKVPSTPRDQISPYSIFVSQPDQSKVIEGEQNQHNDRLRLLAEAIFKLHPRMKRCVDFTSSFLTNELCEYAAKVIVNQDILKAVSHNTENHIKLSTDNTVSLIQLPCNDLDIIVKSRIERYVDEALIIARDICPLRVSDCLKPFLRSEIQPSLRKSFLAICTHQTLLSVQEVLPTKIKSEYSFEFANAKRKSSQNGRVQDMKCTSADKITFAPKEEGFCCTDTSYSANSNGDATNSDDPLLCFHKNMKEAVLVIARICTFGTSSSNQHSNLLKSIGEWHSLISQFAKLQCRLIPPVWMWDLVWRVGSSFNIYLKSAQNNANNKIINVQEISDEVLLSFKTMEQICIKEADKDRMHSIVKRIENLTQRKI